MMKKNIFFLSLLLLQANGLMAASSLSDLSLESFEKGSQVTGSRNPFAPSTAEEIDPASLSLNGTIVGPNAALCLIAKRILKEGDMLGRSMIKEILPGEVVLKSVWGESALKMTSYVSETRQEGDLYEVYFEEANLTTALQMLATVGGFNLILPSEIPGNVSLIFHQTPLKEAMASILRVNKFEYAEENNIVRVGTSTDIPVGADFETAQVSLSYAVAKDIATLVKPLLSEKGQIVPDERTNTLTIKDRPMAVEQMIAVLKQIDIKDPQVHIEAKILDVSKNFSRNLGIQWGFNRETGNTQGFGTSGTGGFNVNLPATGPSSSLGILIGNLISDTSLQAAITAAEADGQIKILSRPSITTLNNTEARIRSGVTIYYKESSDISIGAASSDDTTVNSIETGIELKVTPQITPDDMIKMKITAEESDVDFSQAVDGIPAEIENTAETTVLVRDGETAVIGGLVKYRKSTQHNRVPALSYIPILGWLFKSKAVENTDNELLIFLTPNIVRSNADVQPPPGSAYYDEPTAQAQPVQEEVIEKTIYLPTSADHDRKRRPTMRQ